MKLLTFSILSHLSIYLKFPRIKNSLYMGPDSLNKYL